MSPGFAGGGLSRVPLERGEAGDCSLLIAHTCCLISRECGTTSCPSFPSRFVVRSTPCMHGVISTTPCLVCMYACPVNPRIFFAVIAKRWLETCIRAFRLLRCVTVCLVEVKPGQTDCTWEKGGKAGNTQKKMERRVYSRLVPCLATSLSYWKEANT